MFVALGAVWFLFFIPSWSNRSVEKEQARTERQEIKLEARQEVAKVTAGESAKITDRTRRALSVRRISTVVSFASLAAVAWSTTLVSASVFAWIGVCVGALVFALAVFVNRAASKAYKNSLTESLGRRKVRSYVYAGQLGTRDAQASSSAQGSGLPDNSWSAPGVPNQIFRGSEGSLVDVRFAEVVELGVAKNEQTLESDELNEILRRRRANG